MATMVGKESTITGLLISLIELDYDAIEAYDAAIARLENERDQNAMRAFRLDHERHVRDLSQAVSMLGATPPAQGDVKRVLTKGKVVLGSLAGDRAILMAMRSNENDTNKAYERAVERDLPAPYNTMIENNLADERRHRAWIERRLALESQTAHP